MSIAHVGDVFLWHSPRHSDRADVIQYAEANCPGLVESIPEAPSDLDVLTRMSVVARERGKNHVPRMMEGGEAVFEVNEVRTHAKGDDGTRTDYKNIGAIVLDTTTGDVIHVGPGSVDQAVSAYKASRGHLMVPEWTKVATRFVKDTGARMFKDGIYWLPVDEGGKPQQVLRNLQKLFRAFGGDVFICRTYDDAESVDSLQTRVRIGLSEDIARMDDEIRTLSVDTKEFVWKRRRAAIQELRGRVVYFAETLKFDLSPLEDLLDALEEQVVEHIDEDGGEADRFTGV